MYRGEYRTKSGRSTFKFYYEQQSGGAIRVYITQQPSYGSRATDAHSTHRYGVGAQPYICFGTDPTALQDAITFSKSWAELTERYILTGRDHNS